MNNQPPEKAIKESERRSTEPAQKKDCQYIYPDSSKAVNRITHFLIDGIKNISANILD